MNCFPVQLINNSFRQLAYSNHEVLIQWQIIMKNYVNNSIIMVVKRVVSSSGVIIFLNIGCLIIILNFESKSSSGYVI